MRTFESFLPPPLPHFRLWDLIIWHVALVLVGGGAGALLVRHCASSPPESSARMVIGLICGLQMLFWLIVVFVGWRVLLSMSELAESSRACGRPDSCERDFTCLSLPTPFFQAIGEVSTFVGAALVGSAGVAALYSEATIGTLTSFGIEPPEWLSFSTHALMAPYLLAAVFGAWVCVHWASRWVRRSLRDAWRRQSTEIADQARLAVPDGLATLGFGVMGMAGALTLQELVARIGNYIQPSLWLSFLLILFIATILLLLPAAVFRIHRVFFTN